MKTFERYLFVELLTKLLVIELVFSVIVAANLLSKLLKKVATGDYPADVVASLLFYNTVDSLAVLLPFSAMLAVMLTMGRYYSDSEAYAAFSLGISYARICGVLMKLAVPLALLLFVLVMVVSPAGEQQYKLIKQQGKQRGDVTVVTRGKFFSPREGVVLFVEDHDRDSGKLSNIFIANLSTRHNVLETAAYGEQRQGSDGVKRLHLHDGHLYEGVPGQTSYRVSDYREHSIHLPIRLTQIRSDDPETMTFGELLKSGRNKDQAELQWRMVTVISVPVLMLLAFPLSRVAPRSGSNARIISVIAVFLVYSGVTIVTADLIGSGRFPTFPGVWWVPAVALVAAMLMLTRRHLNYAFRRVLSGISGSVR